MSGSNSGRPPDDSGDDRPRQDRGAGNPRTTREPRRSGSDSDGVSIENDGVVRWFLETNDENVVLVRDILSSVAIVAVIGLILFTVSGIWPPLVAVESGSMQPHMEKGDLIFVVDENRFVGDGAVAGTGVVTLEQGRESGYTKFGMAGDVIVYRPNGNAAETPVIHRAHFWVEEDEKWVNTKASDKIVGDKTCDEVANCPAPYAGFVTKGDHNGGYDQQRSHGADTSVVKSEWITGKAKYRVPWLGQIRLTFDRILGGMLVPGSPASPALQGVDPATITTPSPASPETPGSRLNGQAGIAGIASVGSAAAIGRYRR
ncbi:S26 family signal peptidase [Natrinema caseinilyticum]|uniref:S26 family signal peptidase n=1 Tax=Natrinema caseinilyticum TaxID=2961570 RepID=UPI0020C2D5CC|nr:S26 family signal peptidase [Natrinema caseinilyticum]